MKRFLISLVIFLLIAAAIGYLLYPTLSDQLSQSADAEVMKNYRAKTAAKQTEDIEALFAGAAEYNEKLETVRAGNPFSNGKPRTSADYQSRLNVHSGVIGELVIPGIGVSLPIYHNSAETPAAKKLVHLETSSLPSDQPGTSIVLAGPGVLKADGLFGMIGLTGARMLEKLTRVKNGNLLILNVLDRTMVYRIGDGTEEGKAIQKLSPSGLADLDLTPEEGQELLTLVTPGKDQKLLVIRAARIPMEEAREILVSSDKVTYPETWKNVLLLGSPVLLFGLIVMWVIERIRKHAYLLPGEGKRSAERKQKKKTLPENLPTEPVRVKEHEETNTENAEHDAGHDNAADQPAGPGGE